VIIYKKSLSLSIENGEGSLTARVDEPRVRIF